MNHESESDRMYAASAPSRKTYYDARRAELIQLGIDASVPYWRARQNVGLPIPADNDNAPAKRKRKAA
ncbi:hypothetical protein [Nitrobacter hamburgensis]|uniref:hypothetical protein n=1 Tax=Nitrobacter hamburgensis TaxID=912 RepID=UPI000303C2F0|nr:hypothetical protein [Nitrobacter hamburgensis]